MASSRSLAPQLSRPAGANGSRLSAAKALPRRSVPNNTNRRAQGLRTAAADGHRVPRAKQKNLERVTQTPRRVPLACNEACNEVVVPLTAEQEAYNEDIRKSSTRFELITWAFIIFTSACVFYATLLILDFGEVLVLKILGETR